MSKIGLATGFSTSSATRSTEENSSANHATRSVNSPRKPEPTVPLAGPPPSTPSSCDVAGYAPLLGGVSRAALRNSGRRAEGLPALPGFAKVIAATTAMPSFRSHGTCSAQKID